MAVNEALPVSDVLDILDETWVYTKVTDASS